MKNLNKLIILLVIIFTSCTNDIKYKKELWQETDSGFSSPYRDQMLKDLMANHHLKGMKVNQLLKLLGPADYIENGLITYRIKIKYDGDIDPTYTKNLDFNYSKDSTITSFKIVEWKK